MKRRTLPIAVALAAASALLLTACGGDDGASGRGDEIAGADTGKSTASTSSSGPDVTADRPDMTLPEDVEERFEGWKTGDATEDAVLADAGRAQTAVTYAVTKGDPESPALRFYHTGSALAGSHDWVKASWTPASPTPDRCATSRPKSACSTSSRRASRTAPTRSACSEGTASPAGHGGGCRGTRTPFRNDVRMGYATINAPRPAQLRQAVGRHVPRRLLKGRHVQELQLDKKDEGPFGSPCVTRTAGWSPRRRPATAAVPGGEWRPPPGRERGHARGAR